MALLEISDYSIPQDETNVGSLVIDVEFWMSFRLPGTPEFDCTGSGNSGKDRQASISTVFHPDLVEDTTNDFPELAQGGLSAQHAGAELWTTDLPDRDVVTERGRHASIPRRHPCKDEAHWRVVEDVPG